LLKEGDKILRVEAVEVQSRFISWRLCFKLDQRFKWQLEGVDEQSYAVQVSNLLNPMVERRHNDFFARNVSTRLIDGVDDES
jgi:hypothetical protein